MLDEPTHLELTPNRLSVTVSLSVAGVPVTRHGSSPLLHGLN